MRIFGLAGLVLTLALAAAAAPAVGQAPTAMPPADAMTDPSLKREEVIAFIGVKPGDKVADIISGKFARALSAAVGPTGVRLSETRHANDRERDRFAKF